MVLVGTCKVVGEACHSTTIKVYCFKRVHRVGLARPCTICGGWCKQTPGVNKQGQENEVDIDTPTRHTPRRRDSETVDGARQPARTTRDEFYLDFSAHGLALGQ